ncbi:MAG: ABC transporter ATP-binding protein [Acidimicrobiales bacterium]
MAPITIDKVTKVYPNGFEALHELDLHVAEGEFMVLVGPSGCGKTTALRMVAGLEEITSGTLRIGGRVVNHVASKDRDIAMVFQNYALYPHMTVRENIGFALALRKVPKAEIKVRVTEAAAILGLTEWLDRKPGQLSGGQRQRVAMGRAIVREPSVFLMDEPLSNLDAKLRVQMRAEVTRIQRRLGVATLYVTHDQVEAMTMGDYVAVLRGGALQQCDKPQTLYDNPRNLFVAGFMGSPAMNLFEGALGEDALSVRVGSQTIALNEAVHHMRPALRAHGNEKVVLGVRPEDLSVHEGDPSGASDSTLVSLQGDVELVEALGSELLVHFTTDARRVEAEEAKDADAEGLNAGTILSSGSGIARVEPRSSLVAGMRVRFLLDPRRLHFFDPRTGEAISR